MRESRARFVSRNSSNAGVADKVMPIFSQARANRRILRQEIRTRMNRVNIFFFASATIPRCQYASTGPLPAPTW